MQTETNLPNSRLTDEERTSFRLWLQRELTERCKRNARYSLRAFAKYLDINPSSLSQILSGTRPISKRMVFLICSKLSTRPLELKLFGLRTTHGALENEIHQIDLDIFSSISDWYHYAILEMTFVSHFKAEPKWIAKKLSITAEEAKSALERLKRLGLLIEQNGTLVKAMKNHTNRSSVNTSAAHRELQKQVVEKARIAIDECPPEVKDITSMTMAIDPSNLDRARSLIQKFRRDLSALLEDGEQTQVYNLGIQLYPISKTNEETP